MHHTSEHVKRGHVRGRVSLFSITYPGIEGRQTPRDERRKVVTPWFLMHPNQLQHGWGAIASRCIGLGDRSYRVRAMYIEYENVASPGDPVTAPTYTRDEGIEYYTSLALSADRDFLRVPISFDPTISIEAGFEDSFVDGEEGNLLTFYAQSQGTTGFHGKAFTNAANSKVFGVALVATPEFADQTKDLVFARTYFDTGDQAVKEASKQFGLTWDVSFE